MFKMGKETKPVVPFSVVYLDDEIIEKVGDVLRKGWFILGEESESFEKEFAEFIGVKYAVLTGSGTTAIQFTLNALGVYEGDEIIVPSFTAFPTIEPIIYCKAKPVFVDIDSSYTIDTDKIEEKITKKTVGIIPVHLYGYPANMERILRIADKYNLSVIEDCSQAHNSKFNGQKVGSLGAAGCFSFYPSKNMTVCGDGGIVTTNSQEIAEKVRMLRDHGRTNRYIHEVIGFNSRFNEIQAAIGRIQLKKLDWFTERRRQIAHLYKERLKGLHVILPEEKDSGYHVYHLFVIRTEKRDELKKYLKDNNIDTEIHYPVPSHLQPAIERMRYDIKLPITEDYCKQILSLPIYPRLSDEQVEFVCDKTIRFF